MKQFPVFVRRSTGTENRIYLIFFWRTVHRDMHTHCDSDLVLAQRTVVVPQTLFIDRVVCKQNYRKLQIIVRAAIEALFSTAISKQQYCV